MNLVDLNKVWEIKALKKPGDEEAKKILENIAKQVQPIMRKHKWRVKILSEFWPKNPSLLGLNVGGGVHVKLRLRRANREWDFLPYDQVLDTMLHELCHNAHGPHNANFYKLWDELRKECEELMSKGVTGTGEGFDLPGRRLGGFSRPPPLSSLRNTALAAAENRARIGSLLSSGPKRLGGDSTIMSALSPVQAAAMAAERRFQDDIWCGSQSSKVSEDGENCDNSFEDTVAVEQINVSSKDYSDSRGALDVKPRKRSRVSDASLFSQPSDDHLEPNFIDLTNDASTSILLLDHGADFSKRTSPMHDTAAEQSTHQHEYGSTNLSNPSFSSSTSNLATTHCLEESAKWECGTCTLLNPPLAPICELCSTARPKDAATKYKNWSCKSCTLENSVKLDNCLACGQWRYSHGAPVSTRSSNLGT